MKNMGKILGIVAILAMIVLAVGCSGPADPEDQVLITVTDIGSSYEGKYAFIALLKDKTSESFMAYSTVSKKIVAGIVTCEMTDDDGPWGKDETSYVAIFIDETTDLKGDIYTGATSSPKSIVKGPNNLFSAKDFYPDTILLGSTTTTPDADEKVATFKGVYKASYRSASTVTDADTIETINLSDVGKFIISDAKPATPDTVVDKLEFQIDEWDFATTPIAFSDKYPNAFKFKGKILTSTTGYYGTSSQTGKGITTGDIKSDGSGPDCYMYLYFSNDGKVIRTPFTKDGTTENKDIVRFWNNTSAPLREYTKQQ